MGRARLRLLEHEGLKQQSILCRVWRASVDFVKRHDDWFVDHGS